jgi:hypothetical protein
MLPGVTVTGSSHEQLLHLAPKSQDATEGSKFFFIKI